MGFINRQHNKLSSRTEGEVAVPLDLGMRSRVPEPDSGQFLIIRIRYEPSTLPVGTPQGPKPI